jgi:hypothetical protein
VWTLLACICTPAALSLLLLLLQIHGCHCKDCKNGANGGDCFSADDAAGADLAATPFAAAGAGSEENKKKRGWPVRLVTKYIVPPRECFLALIWLLILLCMVADCCCCSCCFEENTRESWLWFGCWRGFMLSHAAAAAAAAAGSEENKKKGWPVRLATKYIVPSRECRCF